MSIDESIAREVVELHAFFESWFRGELPGTDDAFARFDGVLDPGFEMVAPSGATLDRSAVLTMVHGAHGAMPHMRIWIQAHRSLVSAGDTALVTYEEWQERDGETKARVSTGLFRAAPAAPNGVCWIHVHETWMG